MSEDKIFIFFTDRSQYVILTMGGGKWNGKKQRIRRERSIG